MKALIAVLVMALAAGIALQKHAGVEAQGAERLAATTSRRAPGAGRSFKQPAIDTRGIRNDG
jgi:hypothetical protein